ncbi:MAG: hypothetical protein ATN31_01850 [Candidatus Epulonipiscioides saccharophilum]|nr:MAG: hypothetical protein ATN31_01850 [Epulopiscium sp. AS2M-Bin001]
MFRKGKKYAGILEPELKAELGFPVCNSIAINLKNDSSEVDPSTEISEITETMDDPAEGQMLD